MRRRSPSAAQRRTRPSAPRSRSASSSVATTHRAPTSAAAPRITSGRAASRDDRPEDELETLRPVDPDVPVERVPAPPEPRRLGVAALVGRQRAHSGTAAGRARRAPPRRDRRAARPAGPRRFASSRAYPGTHERRSPPNAESRGRDAGAEPPRRHAGRCPWRPRARPLAQPVDLRARRRPARPGESRSPSRNWRPEPSPDEKPEPVLAAVPPLPEPEPEAVPDAEVEAEAVLEADAGARSPSPSRHSPGAEARPSRPPRLLALEVRARLAEPEHAVRHLAAHPGQEAKRACMDVHQAEGVPHGRQVAAPKRAAAERLHEDG